MLLILGVGINVGGDCWSLVLVLALLVVVEWLAVWLGVGLVVVGGNDRRPAAKPAHAPAPKPAATTRVTERTDSSGTMRSVWLVAAAAAGAGATVVLLLVFGGGVIRIVVGNGFCWGC